MMTAGCIDIGIIQAFLDGELTHDEAGDVSSHIAVCTRCAEALALAEDETAAVFPILAREFDALVPTQRLWNRINESIAAENAALPFRIRMYRMLSAAFASPSLTAATGLLVVAGLASIVWFGGAPDPSGNFVSTPQTAPAQPTSTASTLMAASAPVTTAVASNYDTSPSPRFERAVLRTSTRPAPVATAARASQYADPTSGEASYVNTISALSRTVEDKMDGALRPGQRIAFERDMALIDDTITKMRRTVKRDPRNQAARQVLYSSYQNKIDLLNSVAQKEELMASIR